MKGYKFLWFIFGILMLIGIGYASTIITNNGITTPSMSGFGSNYALQFNDNGTLNETGTNIGGLYYIKGNDPNAFQTGGSLVLNSLNGDNCAGLIFNHGAFTNTTYWDMGINCGTTIEDFYIHRTGIGDIMRISVNGSVAIGQAVGPPSNSEALNLANSINGSTPLLIANNVNNSLYGIELKSNTNAFANDIAWVDSNGVPIYKIQVDPSRKGSSRDFGLWSTALWNNNSGYILYENATSQDIGFGTTNPLAAFDFAQPVQTESSFTTNRDSNAPQAQFGSSIPIYLTSSSPNIGLNLQYYYGWKFGAGSSSNYGANIGFSQATGEIDIQGTTATGNAGGSATLQNNLVIAQDGTLTARKLAGSGNAFVCVNSGGGLYRSAIACA